MSHHLLGSESNDSVVAKNSDELILPETKPASKFAPENGWLEYDPASYWVVSAYFQGLLPLVSGRVTTGSVFFCNFSGRFLW